MLIWLGIIVRNERTNEAYFHIGEEEDPPNSQNPILTKAIMKFFAQHIGKSIEIINEEEIDEIASDDFVEIGNDPALGIVFSEYIDQFEG